jgi:hypothetical protein
MRARTQDVSRLGEKPFFPLGGQEREFSKKKQKQQGLGA